MITGLQIVRANQTSLEALPGEKLELTYGDILRVTTSLEYNGPMVPKATLYGAIGVRGASFNEKVAGEAEVAFPQSDIFTPWVRSVDITIIDDIKPGTDYDLYCKIKEYPEAGMPEVNNVIDIIGIPPTFTLIQHHIYSSYYIYDGEVEVSTFTARISPFSPSSWAAEKFAAEMKNRVEENGGQPLEMKVFVDITSLLWTDIKVEITATPIGGTASTAGHLTTGIDPLVAAIILAALVIIGIIVLTWSIVTIVKQFKHQALSETIKKTWSRDSLISVIGDFEKDLDRPITPPDELAKKTDQGLRDYCDELADIIAPPGLNLLPWLAVGGVALVGIGAAVALSQRKK